MKRTFGIGALVVAVLLCGCGVGVSEQDTANMRKEFSEENYEANMKKLGKEKELEAEKQRQAQSQQDGQ